MAEIGPPDPLTNLCGLSNHAAGPIDPEVVAKSDCFDYKRVARPRRRGIPLPRRIRVLRQRTAISEYLAVNAIHLVEHHEKIGRVNKLEIVREPICTQKLIGKALDVWIINRQ